jgi:NADPH-dependent ferric siderophore reductase
MLLTPSAPPTIRTHLTTVAAVDDVHPRLRRITFAGGDLATFSPLGPDTFLYVLLPPPGRAGLTVDRSFTWELWNRMPSHERPVGAYYTVRAWRPDVAELDMLFVLHEPAGPASSWAASAQPGDPVGLWGPRESYTPPPRADELLLIADDTGLPAAAAIAEAAPPHIGIHLIAEVDGPAEHHPLPVRRDMTVQWIHREGVPAGADPAPLLEAARAAKPTGASPYVWGGGELQAMSAVRRLVRDEWRLPSSQSSLVAYWRHIGSTR